MRKSLLDRFNDLNLQPPIKQAVVAGIIAGCFLLMATVLNSIFLVNAARAGKLPSTTQTQSPSPPVAKQVDPYEFTQAAIRSLSWAADARQVLLSAKQTGDIASDALQNMTNARIAIKKLNWANHEIRKYAKSQNVAVNTAVKGYSLAYLQLTTALEKGIGVDEKFISVSNDEELGTLLNEASKWAAEADEGWKMLMYATAAVAHVLVDDKRLDPDGTIGYLNITAAQRDALARELESSFGESVKKGLAAGQYPTEAAPASLWEFLNQGWKPSDSTT